MSTKATPAAADVHATDTPFRKELGALAEMAARAVGTEIISVDTADNHQIPAIVIDDKRRAIGVETFYSAYEKTLAAPFRRRGLYAAADVKSLLAWMDRHCPEDAPVFGAGLEKLNGEWRNPNLSLVGIGNYSARAQAGWHDFQTRYEFPVTLAWQNWAKKHEEWMSQADFAEFVENNLHDISYPHSGETPSEPVSRFLEMVGGNKVVAAPSQIFELTRGLQITATDKVEMKIDRESGQGKMHYSEEHTGEGGRPLAVPKFFYIRVPVFFGQLSSLVGAILRYRNAGGGKVVWSFKLFVPDLVVAEQFAAACTAVTSSGRTLYLGTPDRP